MEVVDKLLATIDESSQNLSELDKLFLVEVQCSLEKLKIEYAKCLDQNDELYGYPYKTRLEVKKYLHQDPKNFVSYLKNLSTERLETLGLNLDIFYQDHPNYILALILVRMYGHSPNKKFEFCYDEFDFYIENYKFDIRDYIDKDDIIILDKSINDSDSDDIWLNGWLADESAETGN